MSEENLVPSGGKGTHNVTTSSEVPHESKSYMIGGYKVFFPEGRIPFAAQKVVMSKVLEALKKGKNALLESPTGTGKTLALLTSTLTYQKAQYESEMAIFEADCAAYEASIAATSNLKSTTSDTPSNLEVHQPVPPRMKQIIFCSRTHSQLTQVVKELENCHENIKENVVSTTLGSRAQYCINDEIKSRVSVEHSLDDNCRDAVKIRGCKFFKTSRRGRNSNMELAEIIVDQSIRDIEDIKRMGMKVEGCPYFATRSLVDTSNMNLKYANLVFCPYNYVLDAGIRSTTKLCLSGAILVFDEAHNLEDTCRSAASIEVTRSSLKLAGFQLAKLASSGSPAFKSLLECVNGFIDWMDLVEKNKQGRDYPLFHGREALTSLNTFQNQYGRTFGFSKDSLSVYLEHLNTIMKEVDDATDISTLLEPSISPAGDKRKVGVGYEEDEENDNGSSNSSDPPKISMASLTIMKRLLNCFSLMYLDDCIFAGDYRVTIKPIRSPLGEDLTLCLWCLNAAVAFRDLKLQCHSVLLTSGTLSPLATFAADLDATFDVKVEAMHSVDVEKQVFCRAVSTCGGTKLDGSFTNRDSSSYKDALAGAIVSIYRLTPGGTLVFFPSYQVLHNLLTYWHQFGLLGEDLNLFVEPNESGDLEMVKTAFYNHLGKPFQRALFFAICRGKVSEGINFSDHYCRSVVMISIPYPNTQDILIAQKQAYQTEKNRTNEAFASGREWYSHQAYRAINQALGRAIRHANDWGAIFLLDHRFSDNRNIQQLSKWLRPRIHKVDTFEETIMPLKTFFDSLQECGPPSDYFNPTHLTSSTSSSSTLDYSSSTSTSSSDSKAFWPIFRRK